MDITIIIFLSSGLFLGWSLGSNDAANIFGTAVGSGMIRFLTAATVCAFFVVLGAVVGGAGAAHGLGELGAVNAIAGSFVVALAAAVTVFVMTKAGLPVSTTQAVVGAIVGWNLFGGFITDKATLAKIASTWIAAPILGAIFAALLYRGAVRLIHWSEVHIVRLDAIIRIALVLTGAFGAYSLGANNIGNVMGVFIDSSPFEGVEIGGWFTLTALQQLFLLGGLAIGVGVFYSKKVMLTVGGSIMPVNPVGAWVVVMAQSLVLYIFSSAELVALVVRLGLPPYPLVPVSSSQAVIGAVVGIGLSRGLVGAQQIQWRVLLNIASGWVSTPLMAATISFFLLFVVQNVFQQTVYQSVSYQLSKAGVERLLQANIPADALQVVKGESYASAIRFRDALREVAQLSEADEQLVTDTAALFSLQVTPQQIALLDRGYLQAERLAAVQALSGQRYDYQWAFEDALIERSSSWHRRPAGVLNRDYNKLLDEQLDYLYRTFQGARDE